MNKKALISAATCAIAGVGLLHLYLTRLEAETAGGPNTAVLVASHDITPGTALTANQLAIQQLPRAYVAQRQVLAEDSKQVLGVRVSTGLHAGDRLLWSDLGRSQDGRRHLSDLVQEGMRAFTLSGATASSGLIKSGDRVDVLFTPEGQIEAETSTLLQNLMVLAVGGRISPDEADGVHRASGSATLSVTIEQAQLITQAERQGDLKLALRNPDDIVRVEGLPATSSDDVSQARQRKDWRQPQPQTPKTREIEHVR